jgi:hypothetical protein
MVVMRTEPEVGRSRVVAAGHVPVRVLGFHESSVAALPAVDQLGRLSVTLVRQADNGVLVCTPDGTVLGRLPVRWSVFLAHALRRCEARGVPAMARATLAGRRDERDLCVLLPWPSRVRRG